MEKFKEIIGDTIVLYYKNGSAVMGILKSVRIIQDSDREKPFILTELEIGNNTFSFDLNEAAYWNDVTLVNESKEKDLEEKQKGLELCSMVKDICATFYNEGRK